MTLTHNSSTIAQALPCSIGGIPGRLGTLRASRQQAATCSCAKKTGKTCQRNERNGNKPLSVLNKNLLSNVNKKFAVLRLAGKKNYIQTKIELTLV